MILDMIMAIVDRDKAKLMAELFENHKLPMVLAVLGRGTATSEVLDLYGLEAKEKALLITVAGADMTKQLIRAAKHKLFIDVPGNGIMMAIPLKSEGGGKNLAFLSAGGTVLHAKGTGGKLSEKFLGVSLADEKEVVLIVSKAGEKTAIMRAISDQCGVDTPSGAITFSLPISSVAGLRVLDDE